MGRSVSRGTGGPPQTPLQMGRTGSCTGRNTACCALLPCRIRLLSHAVRMKERENRLQQYCLNFASEGVKESSLCVYLIPHHHRAGTSFVSEHTSLLLPLKLFLALLYSFSTVSAITHLTASSPGYNVSVTANVTANNWYIQGRHV